MPIHSSNSTAPNRPTPAVATIETLNDGTNNPQHRVGYLRSLRAKAEVDYQIELIEVYVVQVLPRNANAFKEFVAFE